jgi:hypothetical protein
MRQIIFRIYLMAALGVGLLLGVANAAEKNTSLGFENAQLRLQLFPRSTEQMAGFFEARGFPENMIETLSAYCFFTVIIENKTDGKLWFDLREWNFSSRQKPIARMPRSKWPPMWKELNVPMSAQSTFRWTLLPESLDFYAGESEGGNIILQKTATKFSLLARFAIGKDKRALLANVDDMQCADFVGEE